jgi:Fe-S cluster assembly iron-binding protein IscA
MRRLVPIAALLLAGCSDPSPPVAVPVTPKPVVEFSPRAERLLRQIAVEQKVADPWWVRISVSWRPDPFIEVHLDRKPPGPDDYETEASGLKVVMARELLTYLRGSRVEFVETAGQAGFDVTFPNQDAGEREAASRWLREQTAKHKAEETTKNTKNTKGNNK